MSSRVTLKEIAQKLGVSVMTVSRALNNRENVDKKTREKIINTAHELGYRPNYIARSLVMNKTYTIGVVVPEISHSFFPDVIRGIEEITYQADYQLILTHSVEDLQREKDAIATLESKRVDGMLISMAQTVDDLSFYREQIKTGLPIVFFDRCAYDIGVSCVSINDEESAETITNHLIKEHNYKKIAHLSGPLGVSIGKRRLNGYLKSMREHGLEVHDEWIVESALHEEGGAKAMHKLLDLPKDLIPRAVVAVNDPAAFGAMQAIYNRGYRIPEDIAITGFTDDIRASLMPSPLTTIRQPAYEVGKVAARKLLDHIKNRDAEVEELVVETELVIRNSCGCNTQKNVLQSGNGH